MVCQIDYGLLWKRTVGKSNINLSVTYFVLLVGFMDRNRSAFKLIELRLEQLKVKIMYRNMHVIQRKSHPN